MSLLPDPGPGEAVAKASRFRDELLDCLTARGDELFELVAELLCADGPVISPVDLTLVAEHRRGHGAMYEALNRGNVDVSRLRQVLAGLPIPQAADGRLVLAVDISHWLRPNAPTSADRLFCHVYGRNGRSSDQFIPGWPYSFVAALETDRASWCQPLSASGPRAMSPRSLPPRSAGWSRTRSRWTAGTSETATSSSSSTPDTVPRACLISCAGCRLRSSGGCARTGSWASPSQCHGSPRPRAGGRRGTGKEFRFAKPDTWGEPDAATVQVADRYGTARAMAWGRIHPLLTTRSAWIGHTGELPSIESTLIRLEVDHLPGGGDPLPVWLWSSATGLSGEDVDVRWQAFLRRFDLEHTLRMIKQTLGWTRPKLRTLDAGDRWTWLIIAAHTQLRLLRQAAADLRRPWEKPAEPGRLTPARIRRGFRNVRPHLVCPARAPKPSRPGPDGRSAQRTGGQPPAMTWASS
ncbi:hypothetical protein SSPO_005440 [Streptomyces antimycoticus]|uniref:Transposase IS701-like DDE domain-containing protein n=1 Tax=Streptomyces antimycoticus TaxID=68175 RepID=A0A499UM71_9ACTN|nr:hypothetical protein SSPO_005440 [Streptomyces antimycoticus]